MRSDSRRAEADRAQFAHEVADIVRTLRRSAGLTQAQLASRIGVTQPIIARIENGSGRQTRFELLSRIGRALGKTVRLVFDEPSTEGADRTSVVQVRGLAFRKPPRADF